METLFINGKFLAQRMTGVQRVATNLLLALDSHLENQPSRSVSRWVLLHPEGTQAPPLRQIETRRLGYRGLALHLWEQLRLPIAARGGVLLNLSGSAPWFAARQICMLHDAAPFDCPQSYTRLFKWWYRHLFRRVGARALRLLTVSSFSKQRLIATLGVPDALIDVIPNGADHLRDVVAAPHVLQRWRLSSGHYLLSVGSRNPHKNQAALQEAFVRCSVLGGLQLVIVGGADQRVFAGSAASETPDNVVWTGVIGDSELKTLYLHALALVFPSRYEGFGLPPLEAMSLGCPVVVARAGALPEVCGDAAIYFDPDCIDSICDALRQPIQDAPLRERLCTAGLKRAQQLVWSSSAAQLIDSVERAVAQ